MILLSSPLAQTRNLALTKSLWICCERKRSLFDGLLKRIKVIVIQFSGLLISRFQILLESSDSTAFTKTRCLKLLKFFVSRDQCRMLYVFLGVKLRFTT